jgi:8-oxo-dGTP diphosphatase
MKQELADVYGNRVRVRACGILSRGEQLLMVNHSGITPTNFWSPPGGGVEFGESILETLGKEFREETGLEIETGAFMFGCEFIRKPIHSIELFYRVKETGGKLRTGSDPEIQIITTVRFTDFAQIKKTPPNEVHGIFRITETLGDLEKLTGFYRI